ncbi:MULTISPECIES: hypothetical protein [Mycobacteriaceae]|jgi:hypothetical protein|uniref:Uncharacterized protein n=2 Tax=Mycobacteriaceae TaxID=1762 RepID=A0A1Y0C6B9_9MYCO|nr:MULTISPECIES: hypothetical protein [Mycobacteriaceae]ART70595.1 hypothetical protein BTO20_20435 [Mycobacterium dioxanotrophicus]OMB90689.1 hypothetical protein A5741_11730 [Mycolicibacterium conceptionense]
MITAPALRALARRALDTRQPLSALRDACLRYRRLAMLAVGLATVVGAVMGGLVLVAAVSSPAAAPVAISGVVLTKTADLFEPGGSDKLSGAELAESGADSKIKCLPIPPMRVDTQDVTTPPDPVEGEMSQTPEAGPVLAPLPIAEDGSLERADAQTLIDPVPPGTSTLVAHVWFLYRLAGLGDWDTFVAAYHAADLHEDDESADAPLQQVQALNTAGVDLSRYRLTAASLSAAGQYTGRLNDPYPEYRELVAIELAATCLGDEDVAASQMTMPPPSTATPPPAPVAAAQIPEPHE